MVDTPYWTACWSTCLPSGPGPDLLFPAPDLSPAPGPVQSFHLKAVFFILLSNLQLQQHPTPTPAVFWLVILLTCIPSVTHMCVEIHRCGHCVPCEV